MRGWCGLIFLLLDMCLQAQVTPEDTLIKSVELNVVTICGDRDSSSSEFDFYKTNRLANTEEILARMAGVNLIRRGAFGLEPTLRSYSSGQTNLTIDGMRIYGACTDKMDPVSIYVEPVNLEDIQVTHGASGAIAGSTTGGQINLNLKEPSFACHKKPGVQIAQSFSSVNNGMHTSFRYQQKIRGMAYRVSGTYRKAGDYMSGSDAEVPYSGYEKANLNASVLFRLDTTQVIKLDYLGDWARNIGYPALPMDVGKASAQIFALIHRLTSLRKRFESNELKVYFNTIYHQMDDSHRPDAPMHMDMPGRSSTVGMYNEFSLNKDFMVRLDYHRVFTLSEMIMYPIGEPEMYLQTLPENDLDDMGLALNKTFRFTARQELIVNARVDYFRQNLTSPIGLKQWEVFGDDVSTERTDLLKNLSLAYGKFMGKQSFLRWTLAYGERIPTSNERYGYYLYNRQDQFDYVGNIDLKPESAVQTELLYRFKADRLTFTANLFYHLTRNFIYAYQLEGYDQMTIGALGLKTYRNITSAISNGFEITAKADLTKTLSYFMALKYVHGATSLGTALPLVPPLKLQHALRYEIKYYQFQAEHDYAVSQRRINPDYGDRSTPSFHTVNVRAARNVGLGSMVIQFGVACENILDVAYREHLDIGTIYRPGRNFLLNLGLAF